MVDKASEDLSCLLDDELESSESRFLLKRLDHDTEFRARWSRYHAIGDVMRGHSQCLKVDLSQRVSMALSDVQMDQAQIDVEQKEQRRWMRPFAGAAVAATVAFGVFNWAQIGNNGAGAPDQIAEETSNPSALFDARTPSDVTSAPSLFPRPGTQTASVSGQDGLLSDPRLQSYVLRHNQYSNTRRGHGLVQHIYLVTTPLEQQPEEPESGLESQTGSVEPESQP